MAYYMCLLNKFELLENIWTLKHHMHQGENYPKPLLNLNTVLWKICEIHGTTMQKLIAFSGRPWLPSWKSATCLAFYSLINLIGISTRFGMIT